MLLELLEDELKRKKGLEWLVFSFLLIFLLSIIFFSEC